MNKNVIIILLVVLVAIGGYFFLKGGEEAEMQKEVNENILTFVIESETKPCVGVAPMDCMVVNGEFFYDKIVGFDYEPGYTYELTVERTERENVPADANAYIYTLVEVLSKTAVESDMEAETPLLRYAPQGTEWSYDGGTLSFDEDMNFNMSFGCNTIAGSYTVERMTLTFDDAIMSTRMACPPEIAEKETNFTAMIVKMTSFEERENGTAALVGGEEEMLLEELESEE